MIPNGNYCEKCGSQLVQGANFCEKCGARVEIPSAPQPANPPQPTPPVVPSSSPHQPPPRSAAHVYVPPATPSKKNSKVWILVGGIGCLSVICLAIVLIGGYFFIQNGFDITELTGDIPAELEEVLAADELPTPEKAEQILDTVKTLEPIPMGAEDPLEQEEEPVPTEETLPSPENASGIPGNIGQELSDTYFSDDFSNNQYDWASVQEDYNSFGIENGQYALHLWLEDYVIWAYLPPNFIPNTIGFDAAIVEGADQGAFGVICHYQDQDNYHYVSIDPMTREYSIGYLQDNEYISLIHEMWSPSMFLADSPHAVNQYKIACDPDRITLYINNELEAYAETIPQPSGKMAIYAETWSQIAPDGFRVLFDNLYAFIPVQ